MYSLELWTTGGGDSDGVGGVATTRSLLLLLLCTWVPLLNLQLRAWLAWLDLNYYSIHLTAARCVCLLDFFLSIRSKTLPSLYHSIQLSISLSRLPP